MDEMNNFKEKIYTFIEEADENHVIHYCADNPKGRINIPSEEEVKESDEELKEVALEIAFSLYRLIDENVEINLNKRIEVKISKDEHHKEIEEALPF